MARNNKEIFRFYRSNLATIVWDPAKDRPLATFVNGEFITDNPEIAEKLMTIGYPRVELDAINPPDIMFQKGETLENDIRVLPAAIGETAALNKEKAAAAIEKQKAEIKSPADYQKPKIKRRKSAVKMPDSVVKSKKIKKSDG